MWPNMNMAPNNGEASTRMTEMLMIVSLCPPPGEFGSDAGTQVVVHSLVESLNDLQGERSKLRGELRLLHSQLELKERDRHTRIQAFQQQVGMLSCIRVSVVTVPRDCAMHSLTAILTRSFSRRVACTSRNMVIHIMESNREVKMCLFLR